MPTVTSPRTLAPRSTPREATDRSLPELLLRSAEPVVLESYFAGWERPWRALSDAAWHELFLALGERVRGTVVETGLNREFAARHGLEVIPTVLVFLRGEVVARLTGRVTTAQVVAAVRQALERARERAGVELELAAQTAVREPAAPLRSILRRRAGAPALAHAG